MRNISDIIEQHLKKIMQSHNGAVEIQRSELADKFQCVPSQINYVISTRFTTEKGYIVESKRGGGGYIRIRKVEVIDGNSMFLWLMENIRDEVSATVSENIIDRLYEDEFINERELRLLKVATGRITTNLPPSVRDRFRAEMLRSMLTAIFMY